MCNLTSFINSADFVQERANWNIHAAAAIYNKHLRCIQNQMNDLRAEHPQVLEDKDSNVAELNSEYHQIKGGMASLFNISARKNVTISKMKCDIDTLQKQKIRLLDSLEDAETRQEAAVEETQGGDQGCEEGE